MADAMTMNTLNKLADPRPEPVRGRMPSWVAALLLVGCALSMVTLLSWQWIHEDVSLGCANLLGNMFGERTCTAGIGKALTYLWVLAFLPVMLLLERRIPADPDQPMFSPGMMVDVLWFATFPLLGVWLPNVFDGVLNSSFGSLLEGFRMKAITALPLSVQLLIVILISDFLAWYGHVLRHKSLLWEFHKIHHSQVQLNYFSTRRDHPFDTLAQSLVRFLPFTLLGLSIALPGFLIWSTFLRLWEMFVHANVRMNLGPLKYIVVTPQSHRIHHSLYERHIDTNFGDFFSIWDYLFGYQVKEYDLYPPLGVTDKKCPEGVATSFGGGVLVWVKEMIYPFQALAARFRKSPGGAS